MSSASAGRAVKESFERLLQLHREIGSRIPEYLRPPASNDELAAAEQRLGITLHPQVRELYQLADGVDRDRWYTEVRRWPALLSRYEFPSLSRAVEHTESLRSIAEEVGTDEEIWKQSWLPVFEAEVQLIIVDCATDEGQVRYVWWEATEDQPVARDLAEFIDKATEQMRRHGVTSATDGYGLDYSNDEVSSAEDEF